MRASRPDNEAIQQKGLSVARRRGVTARRATPTAGGRSGCRRFSRSATETPAIGSGMLLVARRAITRTSGVAFAHVRAALGVAVGLAATVVINLAVEVDPHHRVAGTTRFGFSLGRMLPGRRRHADRGWASCRRSGGLALRRRGRLRRCGTRLLGRRRSGGCIGPAAAFGDEVLLQLAAFLNGGTVCSPFIVALLGGFLLRERRQRQCERQSGGAGEADEPYLHGLLLVIVHDRPIKPDDPALLLLPDRVVDAFLGEA